MATDLHKQRASEIFNVPYEDVTDKMRKYAKTVSYIGNYSVSKSLKEQLDELKRQAENNHS